MHQSLTIVIHSLFDPSSEPVSGTGASLFELLESRRIRYDCIHFPIYGNGNAITVRYDGTRSVRDTLRFMPASLLLRTGIEGYIMLRRLIAGNTPVYIGIDPLNALWGIMGKYVLRRVGRVVYYTADYADRRFPNPFLNALYHGIDRLVVRYADQVWNVSNRITELRRKQGLPEEKNFFVPNAPLSAHALEKGYDRLKLVIVGTSVTALDFEGIFDALPSLARTFPGLTLHVVGALRFPAALNRTLRRLERRGVVVCHGPVAHDQVVRLLETSGVGLALYKDRDPWTRYGDSMKIREYLAAGLPVITTDVTSTAAVIEEFGCGRVVHPGKDALISAITDILSPGRYVTTRKRAIEAARAYLFSRIAKKPLSMAGIAV